MDDMVKLCDVINEKFTSSTPNIWGKLRKSASKQIAEQLINELNGVPSICGKLIFEQVNERLSKGRVA